MRDATRLPDADTRALLQQIAARLTAERPNHPMRDGIRTALALTFATRRHGYGTDRATRAEELLLAHAPAVELGMTRRQYAEELRQAAEGGTQKPPCARCGKPFDPADTRFDGKARHRNSPWCRSCVDRCHESTDAFHVCPVCDPARNGGAQ